MKGNAPKKPSKPARINDRQFKSSPGDVIFLCNCVDLLNIPELNKSTVKMKDKNRVKEIIEKLVVGGCDRLQVISDFDMTLSRYVDDKGIPCHSCYQALDISKLLPDKYRQGAYDLKSKYYPIEIDPNVTLQEKIPLMVEWWSQAHELLLGCNIKKNWITQIVSDSRVHFRDGCDWLFQNLHDRKVPLLVFSAGIGDIIKETFRLRANLFENIEVVSNFMDFNEQGDLIGFKGELMHVFNKNENVVHQSDYFDNLSHRHNIILMGDSLGDLGMADGAICDSILRIGFLNGKDIESRLPQYIDAYDIVLVNDQTMSVPNAIIKKIMSTPGSSNSTA